MLNMTASSEAAAIATAVMGILLFFCIVFVVRFIFYVLESIGLMRIAKKDGIKYSWMAWLPIARDYLLGTIAFNKKFGFVLIGVIISSIMLPLLQLSLIINFVANIALINNLSGAEVLYVVVYPILGLLILLIIINSAIPIFKIVCFYKIYEKMSAKAMLLLIFSVLTAGLLTPIFIFAISKNDIIGEDNEATSNDIAIESTTM